MTADIVKCPHCFGEKPAAANVCLHCGRDEQGFGPMIRSSEAVIAYNHGRPAKRSESSNLSLHLLIALASAGLGFLIMLTSGLGSLLFVFGIGLLLVTRARMWWRKRH